MNHFLENSINSPPRCGWVDCKNVSEPGTGRCIHHKEKSREPYIGMRMKTGKKFNKTHELVYRAYKWDKEIVNDEMVLLAYIWERFEGWDEDYKLIINLKKVTHPETISRRRRELHEAGLIEYSPKAMKSRETAFKNERDKTSPIPPQMKWKMSKESGQSITDRLTIRPPQMTKMIKSNETTPEGERCVLHESHLTGECIFEPLEQTRLV